MESFTRVAEDSAVVAQFEREYRPDQTAAEQRDDCMRLTIALESFPGSQFVAETGSERKGYAASRSRGCLNSQSAADRKAIANTKDPAILGPSPEARASKPSRA